MRISDWSSDVCSSDLGIEDVACDNHMFHLVGGRDFADPVDGVEAGFAKRRAHLGLEPAEGLAELPVSCVAETHASRSRIVGRRKRRKRKIGRALCRERVCQYV